MKNDCYLKLLSLLGVLLFLAACEKDSANDSVVRVTPTTPVNPANKAPVARAGEDAIIYVPLNTCTLNGSASADPDGDNLTYTWRIISGQSIFGKTEFSGSSNVGLYLNPGNYQFELTVSDVGKLSSKDTVNVTCIEPVCTGANKEVVIQNVAWDHSWIMAIAVEKVHSYLPPNSYIKKFYIKRDGSTTWEAVIPIYSDPALSGKIPEWNYGNGAVAIFPGANMTDDTPDIKIEYCN